MAVELDSPYGKLSIDIEQARRFLRALCNSPNEDPVVIFQCYDDTKLNRPGLAEHKAGTILQLEKYLRAQNERGASICVQLNSGGRLDSAIVGIRDLAIDDDLKSPKRPDLTKLPPSIIVHSSRTPDGIKVHSHWLLNEEEQIDRWLPAMQHLAKVHSTDIGICKLNLVMRVPGFIHHKGNPQRVELIECNPDRRYTITEILEAYPLPSNGINGSNGVNGHTTHKKHEIIDQALAGTLPAPTIGADGRDTDETPHTSQSEETFQHLIKWLDKIKEPYTTRAHKPRFIYLTNGCPRNRTHKDAVIIAATRGGIVGKCFHDSCGSIHKNSWRDFRTILGGWADLERGDHVELATKLRNDLRYEYKSELIAESSHKYAKLYRYLEDKGYWDLVPDDILQQRVNNYAGLTYGPRATAKKINEHDVSGVVKLLKVICAQAAFFEQAPIGTSFTNGFLIVQKDQLELKELVPENRTRASFPFPYDPNADAPLWLQTLQEIFKPDPDAEEKIAFLQDYFGVCILGIATNYQKAVIFLGDGANGKSLILKVLAALFPPLYCAAVRPQDMDSEYARANLYGKRINIVSEVPEREILHPEGFKAMLSGDMVTGRPIREAPITFRPTAAHIFACNNLPNAADFTQGFWRRIVLILFNRQFADSEQNEKLAQTLIETELPGICNWCLIGARRVLARQGYQIPASSEKAKEGWREDADSVLRFVEEETTKCTTLTGSSLTDLYQAYRLWADENGHAKMSKITLSIRLKKLRVQHRRGRRLGSEKERYYERKLTRKYSIQ